MGVINTKWCDVTESAISASVDDEIGCMIPDIYHPVCAELDGELIDYSNEYEAECEYVSVSTSVCPSVLLYHLTVVVCHFLSNRIGTLV